MGVCFNSDRLLSEAFNQVTIEVTNKNTGEDMNQSDSGDCPKRRQADLNRMVLEHLEAQQKQRLDEAMAFWHAFFKTQERNKQQESNQNQQGGST